MSELEAVKEELATLKRAVRSLIVEIDEAVTDTPDDWPDDEHGSWFELQESFPTDDEWGSRIKVGWFNLHWHREKLNELIGSES